jgi:hypothetical protein
MSGRCRNALIHCMGSMNIRYFMKVVQTEQQEKSGEVGDQLHACIYSRLIDAQSHLRRGTRTQVLLEGTLEESRVEAVDWTLCRLSSRLAYAPYLFKSSQASHDHLSTPSRQGILQGPRRRRSCGVPTGLPMVEPKNFEVIEK